MAKQFDALSDDHRGFIEASHIFFVATAAATGRVNVSPKGMDSLRVLGPNRIAWLNVTGSGNETAGHLTTSNRMTLMWAGFEKRPLILRVYGTRPHPASGRRRTGRRWRRDLPALPGARQIFDLDDRPRADLLRLRACPISTLPASATRSSTGPKTRATTACAPTGTRRTATTIDGAPTGIFGDDG